MAAGVKARRKIHRDLQEVSFVVAVRGRTGIAADGTRHIPLLYDEHVGENP
jgi:hypothetical protein